MSRSGAAGGGGCAIVAPYRGKEENRTDSFKHVLRLSHAFLRAHMEDIVGETIVSSHWGCKDFMPSTMTSFIITEKDLFEVFWNKFVQPWKKKSIEDDAETTPLQWFSDNVVSALCSMKLAFSRFDRVQNSQILVWTTNFSKLYEEVTEKTMNDTFGIVEEEDDDDTEEYVPQGEDGAEAGAEAESPAEEEAPTSFGYVPTTHLDRHEPVPIATTAAAVASTPSTATATPTTYCPPPPRAPFPVLGSSSGEVISTTGIRNPSRIVHPTLMEQGGDAFVAQFYISNRGISTFLAAYDLWNENVGGSISRCKFKFNFDPTCGEYAFAQMFFHKDLVPYVRAFLAAAQ